MANVDISKLSVPELRKLMEAGAQRITEMRSATIVEARTQIEEILSSYGLELTEVFPPGRAPGARRSNPTKGKSIPPKYRNPDDPAQTWTGRGKKPAWFLDALEAGHSEESMLI